MSESNDGRREWAAAEREILSRLDLRAELEALGVRFAKGEANDQGWLACFAVGREDRKPSAAVNVASNNGQLGKYTDKGGDAEKAISFFELAARVAPGRFVDWRDAREKFAKQTGVDLPEGGDAESQIRWADWSPATVRGWCEDYKRGIDPSAVRSSGSRICWWPANSYAPCRCVAVPAYAGPGDPMNWVLYRTDGREFPAFEGKTKSVAARKVHTLRGKKDGWVIAAGGAGGWPSIPVDWTVFLAATDVWRCEGPTDALALASILPAGHVAVSNVHGCSSLSPSLPWEQFRGKRFWSIGDLDKPGQAGAEMHAKAAAGAGAAAAVVRLPGEVTEKHGQDLRDWVKGGGTWGDLQSLAAAATPPRMDGPPLPCEKARVVIRTAEDEVVSEAVAAISKDPKLFRRGRVLVHVTRDKGRPAGIIRPDDAPQIAAVPLPIVRERLAANINWIKLKETKDGTEEIPAHPPEWAIRAVAARGEWPEIRPMEGIVETPVLRVDGSVLDVAGYDADTGLLYEPSQEFDRIPANPTKDDAAKAAAELLEVVQDFPFEDEKAHRAAWLASILTPLARFAFPGPAPMFLIDANTPGTGKGLICDTIGYIVTGRPIGRTSYPSEDDEMRKRITATALAGDRMVLLDNIDGTLGTPSLDAMLTATTWKDRILGRTENSTDIPLSAVWYATGNNILLGGDIVRRICHIRLSTGVENPEGRTDFHHPDLLGWITENRRRLVPAALTILRAYCVAGRPKQDIRPWGSFEGWSQLVRTSLVWIGQTDPVQTRHKLARESDQSTNSLRSLIHGWLQADPKREGITVVAALKMAADHAELCPDLCNALAELGGKNPNPRSLGMKLHHLRHRIVDGQMMDRTLYKGVAHWFVAEAGSGKSEPESEILAQG